jgi:hypothetical protein
MHWWSFVHGLHGRSIAGSRSDGEHSGLVAEAAANYPRLFDNDKFLDKEKTVRGLQNL